MGRMLAVVVSVVASLSLASMANAQSHSGWYIGGSVGAGLHSNPDTERVRFDTNLDGGFGDTVRTAAGADAFSPGFCSGLAVNAMAASGCTEDENGIDFGGRVGYDASAGRLIVGGLVDISTTGIRDSVTAFSTTPAFYSFVSFFILPSWTCGNTRSLWRNAHPPAHLDSKASPSRSSSRKA